MFIDEILILFNGMWVEDSSLAGGLHQYSILLSSWCKYIVKGYNIKEHFNMSYPGNSVVWAKPNTCRLTIFWMLMTTTTLVLRYWGRWRLNEKLMCVHLFIIFRTAYNHTIDTSSISMFGYDCALDFPYHNYTKLQRDTWFHSYWFFHQPLRADWVSLHCPSWAGRRC